MQKFSYAILLLSFLAVLQESFMHIQAVRVRVVRVRKDKRQAFSENQYNNNYPTRDSYTDVDSYSGAEANPFNVGSKPQDYPDRQKQTDRQGPQSGGGAGIDRNQDRYGPPGSGGAGGTGDFGGGGGGGVTGTGGGGGQTGGGDFGTGPGSAGGPADGGAGGGTGSLGGGGKQTQGGGGSRGPGTTGTGAGGNRGPGLGGGAVGVGKQKTTVEPSRSQRQPDGSQKKVNDKDKDNDDDCQNCVAGIPGEPGVDYPIYDTAPKTSFACKAQKWPGYYADKEARCQAFYICQQDRMSAFLCPNGTVFNQQVFVCDWWFNVDCGTSDSYFSRNQYLYQFGIGIDGQPVGSSSGKTPSGSKPIPAFLSSRSTSDNNNNNNNNNNRDRLGSGSDFGERTYSRGSSSQLYDNDEDDILGARLNRNNNHNYNKGLGGHDQGQIFGTSQPHGADSMISRTIAPMHSMHMASNNIGYGSKTAMMTMANGKDYNNRRNDQVQQQNHGSNSNKISQNTPVPKQQHYSSHESKKAQASSNSNYNEQPNKNYNSDYSSSSSTTVKKQMGTMSMMTSGEGMTQLQKALAQFTSSSPVHYINNVKSNGQFGAAEGARVNSRSDHSAPSNQHVNKKHIPQQQQQNRHQQQQRSNNGPTLGARIDQFSNSHNSQKSHNQQKSSNHNAQASNHQQQQKNHQSSKPQNQNHKQQNNNNKAQSSNHHQQNKGQSKSNQHHSNTNSNSKGHGGFSSNQVSLTQRPAINANVVHNSGFGSKTSQSKQSYNTASSNNNKNYNNNNNNNNNSKNRQQKQQPHQNYRSQQTSSHQIQSRENNVRNQPAPLMKSEKPQLYYTPPKPTKSQNAQQRSSTTSNSSQQQRYNQQESKQQQQYHQQQGKRMSDVNNSNNRDYLPNSSSNNYQSQRAMNRMDDENEDFPIDVPLLMPRGASKSILNDDYLPSREDRIQEQSRYEPQLEMRNDQISDVDYAESEPSSERLDRNQDSINEVVEKPPVLIDNYGSSSGHTIQRLPSPSRFTSGAAEYRIKQQEQDNQIPDPYVSSARYTDFVKSTATTNKRGIINNNRINQIQQQQEQLAPKIVIEEDYETTPNSNFVQDYTEDDINGQDEESSSSSASENDESFDEFPTTVRYAQTLSSKEIQDSKPAQSIRNEKSIDVGGGRSANSYISSTTLRSLSSSTTPFVSLTTSKQIATTEPSSKNEAESSTFGQKITKGVRKSSYSNWSNYFYLHPNNK